MEMFKIIGMFSLVFVLLTGMAQAQNQDNQDAIDKGATAMKQWLALVDAGDYGASWDETAAFFRQVVEREQWIEQLTTYRTPMGKVLQRGDALADYTTSLPGAPDGEYVIMQLQTSFENKVQAVETITAMLDPDGVWRVAGYYIK
jgi:hypothetical protein